MAKIIRIIAKAEEVEVPEGFKVCSWCDGRGMLSRYDRGWKSPIYYPALAALEACFMCQGVGYYRET